MLKTYFYSGHISRLNGGAITFEFSGLVEAVNAIAGYKIAYSTQLRALESKGGDERSQCVIMDAFNLVEGV